MVDTEEQLQEFLATLREASWVAVDTEADSLHAYPEKVCLIQISTRFGERLLDPLAGLILAPVLQALSAHELIMHGADYDLRLLRKHHEFVPRAIFDTMLAARLLGVRHFGLSHLTEAYLDVKLEKGPQKANWALRPLTERMERYARNDTRYLKPLADRLKQELLAKNRLGWHQEACARLIQDCTQEQIPDSDLVWRVKGSHLLGRLALAVLRELWRWREREALTANRPPFFVMSHELLVELAAAAANGGGVGSLLPRHLSERRRGGVLKAITRGLDLAAEHQPRLLKSMGRRPSEPERRRFLDLQKRRDTRATELAIDPTLIASRGTLSNLALNWEMHSSELMTWQRELLKG